MNSDVKHFLCWTILFSGVVVSATLMGQVLPFAFWTSPSLKFGRLWVWTSGSNGYNWHGVYGTQGTGSTSNYPGARNGATLWADGSGHLWMFGGTGYGATTGPNQINDLWKYDPSNGQWTWVAGSNEVNSAATFGTKGTGSTSNIPSARSTAGWKDSSGNFWLFGGIGQLGYSNDLWMFNPTNNQWTWVSGSSTGNQNGVYGTQGTGSTSNIPGVRSAMATWVDASGNFWIFGGTGLPATGSTSGALNDLWEYTPSSSAWTWVSGVNTINHKGICGTQGSGSTANYPGGRSGAATWIDTSGNLWVYGGIGYDGNNNNGWLNDLWMFNPSNNQWTWVNGNCPNHGSAPVTGSLGFPAASNTPGAKSIAGSWRDSSGNFWLIAGENGNTGIYDSNDLWMYSLTTSNWTWLGGSATYTQAGIYGTQGVSVPGNYPGAREGTTVLMNSGQLWLFGGYDQTGYFNDLWSAQ